MFDSIKRGMYMGLGLATMTKDKVESIATDMASYSRLSEEEGRKLAERLQEESEEARRNLEKTIDEVVNRNLDRLPLRRRIRELEDRLSALEARVATLAATTAGASAQAGSGTAQSTTGNEGGATAGKDADGSSGAAETGQESPEDE